ncbi:MAG: hypothetical protein KAI18_01720 [Candidatus Aenigmarchaeota archaeon]|nr:hypothetical protein [Candidatus Aenigmarchaeota archaeon]
MESAPKNVDLLKVKKIWKSLTYEEDYADLENKNVLNILADEEIINIVKKYKDEEISKEVAGYIIYSISFLDDKETILKMSRIIGLDKYLYSASMALYLCDILTLDEVNAKRCINWAYEAEILGETPHNNCDLYDDLKSTLDSAKECNVKYYSFEGENSDFLNYSKDDLLKYSIISIIGSTDKALEAEAENSIIQIVGKTILNKAKNTFNTTYKYTKKDEFNKKRKSDLLKNIFKNFRQHNYEDAYKLLNNTNDEAICDVLNAANYKDVDIANANFIRATESNNPLDYDNRTQLACVYLPSGENNEAIIKYCNDDSILLIRYDIGSKTLGSAICAFQDDIFLVDSVEGHRTTRKDKVFEIIYNDLIYRAKMKNAKQIIFNRIVANETPIKFIEYIGKKGLDNTIIDMDIDIYTLEAADEENTKGYFIELKE